MERPKRATERPGMPTVRRLNRPERQHSLPVYVAPCRRILFASRRTAEGSAPFWSGLSRNRAWRRPATGGALPVGDGHRAACAPHRSGQRIERSPLRARASVIQTLHTFWQVMRGSHRQGASRLPFSTRSEDDAALRFVNQRRPRSRPVTRPCGVSWPCEHHGTACCNACGPSGWRVLPWRASWLQAAPCR